MCWIADPLWPKMLDPGPLPHWNQFGLATLLIRFMLIFVASCLKRLQLVRAKKQVTHTFKPPPVRRFKVTAIYLIHLSWNCHFLFTSQEIAIFYSPLMKLSFFILLSWNCHFFSPHMILPFFSPLMKLPRFIHLPWNCHFLFTSHEIAIFYSPLMKLLFSIHLSWDYHFLFTSHEIAIFYSPLMILPFFYSPLMKLPGEVGTGTLHWVRLKRW